MIDPFAEHSTGLSDVATRHFAIVPSDDADLPVRPRALYCLTDGNVTVRDEAGTEITYAVYARDQLPIRAIRVLATGTTATLVGWI